jgi:hypothetical protein
MSKDKTKNLVGQPIFKQIMKILPREQFDFLVGQCGSDRDNEIFKLYYFALIKYFEPLLSVSRKEKIMPEPKFRKPFLRNRLAKMNMGYTGLTIST